MAHVSQCVAMPVCGLCLYACVSVPVRLGLCVAACETESESESMSVCVSEALRPAGGRASKKSWM